MTDYLSSLQEQADRVGAGVMPDYMEALRRQADDVGQMQFGATVANAITVNPDTYARQRSIAQRMGVPTAAVEALPVEMDARDKSRQIDLATQNNPALRLRYTDKDFANLAHDDSTALDNLKKAAQWLMNPAQSISTPKTGVMTNADYAERIKAEMAANPAIDADTARMLALKGSTLDNASVGMKGSQRPAVTIENLIKGIGVNVVETGMQQNLGMSRISADLLGNAMQAADAKRKSEASEWRQFMGVPEPQSKLGQWIYGGVNSAAQQFSGIATSVAMGNPIPALASIGLGTMAGSYGKYRDRGGSIGEALLGSSLEGALEVLTELLPMKMLTDKIGKIGVGAFAKEFLGKELIGEEVNTLLSNAVDTAIANPDKTWGQYFKEIPEQAAATLVQTLVQTGIFTGAHAVLRKTLMAGQADQYKADTAEGMAQSMEAVQKSAEATKLLKRSPDDLRSYMQQLVEDGVPNIYIDSTRLTDAGVDMQELSKLVPSVANQLPALDHGGDLVIPTAELLTNTIGSSFSQVIIDNSRTDLDAMSRAEAKEYLAEKEATVQTQLAEALEKNASDAEFMQGRDWLHEKLTEKLNEAGRFSNAANKQMTMLTATYYAVQAQKLGMTAQEFAKEYDLGFATEAKPGQPAFEDIGPSSTKSAEVRQAVDMKKRQSILNSLAECMA